MGGHVYRGLEEPLLDGHYVFGDHCSGRIWTIHADAGSRRPELGVSTDLQITSFGEDQAGEVHLVDLAGGALYRVVPADPTPAP
ncbi:hypothetical protein BH20CHL6_BH20CHL6_04830 [soil metagenome]